MNKSAIFKLLPITSKEQIFKPIPKGIPFRASFVRKAKTKNGDTKYYLYTEDQQDLLLVSSKISSSTYVITQDSLDVSTTNEKFMGHIVYNSTHISFLCSDQQEEEQIYINYKKGPKEWGKYREIIIKLPNEEIQIEQRKPTKCGKTYSLMFPVDCEMSKKNLILEYKSEFCLVFGKMDEEEFVFIVRHPLSIFQGFCVAISTMTKSV